MVLPQVHVPFGREVEERRIGRIAITHANKVLILVFEEISNALESTSIAGPSSCARNATGKLFVLVSIGHASGELKLRMELDSWSDTVCKHRLSD